jgi:TPR repeat protein
MAHSMKIRALVAATTLLLASTAGADVKKGMTAWQHGDYPAAVHEWQPLADKGDPDAQFNLGQAYNQGHGVAKNPDKALALFQQAAGKGHVLAASFAGLMLYERGERVAAMPLLKTASDHGDARAQYVVGLACFNGDLLPKDWVRAYALVSLANTAGLPQAATAQAQMDTIVPAEQRKQGLALAAKLASKR